MDVVGLLVLKPRYSTIAYVFVVDHLMELYGSKPLETLRT